MEGLIGRWRIDRSRDEGVQKFLEASGVPKEFQKTVMDRNVSMEYVKDGDKIKMTVNTEGLPSKTCSFKLGQSFDFETPEGVTLKCLNNFEGNRYVETFEDNSGNKFGSEREIKGDVMKVVTTMKGVSMTQYFNKY